MKAARTVVSTVAIAASGVAAMPAGVTTKQPAQKPTPVAKVDTVDVLAARADTGNFIRRKPHSNAIEGLSGSIVRVVRFGVTATTTPL